MDSYHNPCVLPHGFPWSPISPLGSGSSAHVSLALNLLNGSLFALKSIPSPSPPLLAMAFNELHILQSLSSPFVIRCLGAHLSPASLHLFLEYMDGGSLADLIKKSGGTLDERCTRLYTHSILQGLRYLHENGIVHSDIKGQNILVGSSGVKIADFGAAKRLGDYNSQSSSFTGTPLWMAPEVVQGREQGCPSDIWSLGCTVVEMLQGRPPWGHISSVPAALYKIGCLEDNPPLPAFVSEEAKDFLHRCLQRDASKRWTAAELLQHPFICRNEEGYGEQASPRSALEFVHDGEESDWEIESDVTSGRMLSLASMASQQDEKQEGCRRRAAAALSNESIPEASEWVTVKRMNGWSSAGEREMPFMASEEGAMLRIRGCDVSLEAAAFLRNRKMVG